MNARQKAIEGLTELLNCSYIGSLSGEDIESLENAVETMRKYQQIEEMVKQYKKFGNIDFSMQIISGVVEDGKND